MLVYPQGERGLGVRGWQTGWNTGFGFTEYAEFDDVGFVETLMAALSHSLNIDTDQIYVVGFSLGGMMAHRLGAELSDKLAAIAAYGASIGYRESEAEPWQMISEPQTPLSVGIFHGMKDEYIPFEGGCESELVPGCWHPVREAVEFWVEHNACSSPALVKDTSHIDGLVREYYDACQDQTEVAFYVHKYRGHLNWWDQAEELIWEFLRRVMENSESALSVQNSSGS